MIPLSIEEGTFRVAVADIYNLPALDYLRYHTPFVQKVIPVIAPESDILEAIDGFYGYNLLIPALLRELEEASPHIFSKNRSEEIN